jgi:diadenosine tetraphosphate (Ap4A) HIT family hydrolase
MGRLNGCGQRGCGSFWPASTRLPIAWPKLGTPVRTHCPFCKLSRDRIVFESELGLAFRDGYQVSQGHTLIVPKRHVETFFDTTPNEQAALLDLLRIARADLDRLFHPAGYNIGINDGVAAGQTVMHLHLHLIPRYDGDRADPRGGVRWVLPDKAAYWDKN